MVPKKYIPDNTTVSLSDGEVIVNQGLLPIHLNATDLNNILVATQLLFGSPKKAIISEIGIVSGYEWTGTDSGLGITYKEVRCAQVMSFSTRIFHDLLTNPTAYDFNFSLSNTAPLPPTTV
jgi:hypothetical protein